MPYLCTELCLCTELRFGTEISCFSAGVLSQNSGIRLVLNPGAGCRFYAQSFVLAPEQQDLQPGWYNSLCQNRGIRGVPDFGTELCLCTELRFCGTELWGPKPVIPDQRFCRLCNLGLSKKLSFSLQRHKTADSGKEYRIYAQSFTYWHRKFT